MVLASMDPFSVMGSIAAALRKRDSDDSKRLTYEYNANIDTKQNGTKYVIRKKN